MSTEVIDQLARYGDFVREELAEATSAPGSRAAPLTLQVAAEPEPRRRADRLVLVAVLAALLFASGLITLRLARDQEELVASPVSDPALIERRATDTEPFLERLPDVDFEMSDLGQREPTDTERAAVVSFFGPQVEGIGGESVTIVQEFEAGQVVVEFNVDPREEGEFDATLCRAVGRSTSSGLDFGGRLSCWDPTNRPVLADDAAPSFSFGCVPAFDIPGGSLFGQRGFVAQVDLPPSSPGVVFTLDNDDVVLLRPNNNLVVYAGPVAERMEIFYANGEVHTINTSDCL